MSSLYILRHGKTEWNHIKKLQGHTDIPLNEEGIKMAEDAAKRYANVPFDICFCSPLSRAKETARILLEGRDVPIEYDDRLMEIGFGNYEGLDFEGLPKDHPIMTFFFDPGNYVACEGAESIADLIKRTGSFLSERVHPLLDEGKDVLIVGHGAMNSSVILNEKGLPVDRIWQEGIENCVLKRIH